MKNELKKMPGFTLIELLITLAILGVLAMLVVPVIEIAVQRQREQELRAALIEIRAGIDAYKKASDEGRVRKEIGASGYPSQLSLLVEGIVDQRDPRGRKIYFLRRIPSDPMVPRSQFQPEQSWGLRSYASTPNQPEAGADVFDIYSKSTKIGLNGISYAKW